MTWGPLQEYASLGVYEAVRSAQDCVVSYNAK